jgi:hypothetical protein
MTVNPNSTDPDQITSAIDNYEALRDVRAWIIIAAFVRTFVKSVHPHNVRKAREFMMAAARFIDWCVTSAGLPLGPDLFRTDLVEAYLHSASVTARLSERTRALASGHLNDLVRRITEQGAGTDIAPRTYQSHPSDTYTPRDLPKLYAWARTRRVGRVKRNAHAILALGLGFGMTSAVMLTVRPEAFSDRGSSGLMLTLDGQQLWCDELHESSLREVLDTAVPGRFLIELSPNQTLTDFLRTSRQARRPIDALVPEINRLRATWFIRRTAHFSALRAVMAAYRIRHTNTLHTFIDQLPMPSDAEARRVFRTGDAP